MRAMQRFFPLVIRRTNVPWRTALRMQSTGKSDSVNGEHAAPNNTANTPSEKEPLSQLVQTLKTQLEEKEGQIREHKDSYLRALAEMENLRQRTRREIEASSQYAIQKFCKNIVEVVDLLEMALASAKPGGRPTPPPTEQAQDDSPASPLAKGGEDAQRRLQTLLDGLALTMEEMHKALAKHGVTIVDPLYQKFDPNVHNALFEVPAKDVEPGTVVTVQKKGYMLNQRVMRPADVGVSRKA